MAGAVVKARLAGTVINVDLTVLALVTSLADTSIIIGEDRGTQLCAVLDTWVFLHAGEVHCVTEPPSESFSAHTSVIQVSIDASGATCTVPMFTVIDAVCAGRPFPPLQTLTNISIPHILAEGVWWTGADTARVTAMATSLHGNVVDLQPSLRWCVVQVMKSLTIQLEIPETAFEVSYNGVDLTYKNTKIGI